ncbi:TA system VapC family ribonuclease toxin [Gracilinema caldarium]|uniref:TA system VapC family ribonuclease toxin n=1 Tax=Gracilinema caldarium TaxID=215591 RepID=UPI0026ECC43D|nr:TA system VapC family ribonuclease toxin [Gracilinema caldarium]
MIIPDLNILLYAVDSSSIRHQEAKNWLEKTINSGKEIIGIPWIVHLGFLRLTTSPKIFPRPLSIDTACMWMDSLKSNPSVVSVEPGKAHASLLRHLLLVVGTAGNLVSDAHLAALALEKDATIVTGDRDFLRFQGLKVTFLF